jgi:hypothetical protein
MRIFVKDLWIPLFLPPMSTFSAWRSANLRPPLPEELLWLAEKSADWVASRSEMLVIAQRAGGKDSATPCDMRHANPVGTVRTLIGHMPGMKNSAPISYQALLMSEA